LSTQTWKGGKPGGGAGGGGSGLPIGKVDPSVVGTAVGGVTVVGGGVVISVGGVVGGTVEGVVVVGGTVKGVVVVGGIVEGVVVVGGTNVVWVSILQVSASPPTHC